MTLSSVRFGLVIPMDMKQVPPHEIRKQAIAQNAYYQPPNYILTGIHKTIGQHHGQASNLASKLMFDDGVSELAHNNFYAKLNDAYLKLMTHVEKLDLPEEEEQAPLEEIDTTQNLDFNKIKLRIQHHLQCLAGLSERLSPDTQKLFERLKTYKIIKVRPEAS
jgi:hypothetical protein